MYENFKSKANNCNFFMNRFFFSRSFIKQVSLLSVAAWLGCPHLVNAEGMVVESGAMSALQQSVEAKGLCMMQLVFRLSVHQLSRKVIRQTVSLLTSTVILR